MIIITKPKICLSSMAPGILLKAGKAQERRILLISAWRRRCPGQCHKTRRDLRGTYAELDSPVGQTRPGDLPERSSFHAIGLGRVEDKPWKVIKDETLLVDHCSLPVAGRLFMGAG